VWAGHRAAHPEYEGPFIALPGPSEGTHTYVRRDRYLRQERESPAADVAPPRIRSKRVSYAVEVLVRRLVIE
jgi:hypothetical protein